MDDQPEDRSDETRRNPINDLYRLADIERFHIIRMDQKQSVAEHSFFVTLLSMRIAGAIGAPVGRVVQWALLHDAEEAWTGDIPSPVKANSLIDFPIKEMMGDMYVGNVSPITRHIVKLADMAEAIKYLGRNGKSRHAQLVEHNLRDRLWELAGTVIDEHPKFDWDRGLVEIKFYLDNSEETFIDDYV